MPETVTIRCPHCEGTGILAPKTLQPERIRERFDAKWLPDLKSDCWVWVASVNQHGYGMLSMGTRLAASKTPRLAHRVGYELYRGKIPNGRVLDHLCRNRFCVNPWHLDVVTQRENTLRGLAGEALWAKQRAKTHCPHGHPFSGSNLYRRPDGSRGCKACIRTAQQRHRERRDGAH